MEDEIKVFRFRGFKIGECLQSNYAIVGIIMPDMPSIVATAKPIFVEGDTKESVEFKIKTIRMSYEYARCSVANLLAEGKSLYDIILDFPNMDELEEQGFDSDMLAPFRMFLWQIKAQIAHYGFALLVARKDIDKANEIRELIVSEFITNIETLPKELRARFSNDLMTIDDEGNTEFRTVLNRTMSALNKPDTDKNISKDNKENGDNK
jgi:hypothetical protein